MKKCVKKITSCIVVVSIGFCSLDSFIIFAKEGDNRLGETSIEEHYMDDGIPVVRRQVIIKENKITNSSLRKAIKQKTTKENSLKTLPPKIDMNNIVIFLRFKGEKEFVTDQNRDLFINHYNGSGVSLKSYMKDISYGQFNVLSDFFPVDIKDNKFCSYEAKNPREYYQPFSGNNALGYKSATSSNNREFELLSEAISYCRPMIEKRYTNPVEIDFDEDGKVDNVVFVVSGREDSWEDLLWPHQFLIPKTYTNAKIHDKRVKLYNLMLQSCFKENNVGTSSHEFLHTKGFPDFYRYKSNGEPVGCWDLMSVQHSVPQFPLVYPRYKYGAFCNKPTKIKQGGKYILYPSTSQDYKKDISYVLKSPTTDAREYFVVEYRSPAKYEPGEVLCNNDNELTTNLDLSKHNLNKNNMISGNIHWDQMLPGEGLLVYRVNKDIMRGNAASNGIDIPDKLFIFRKGITEAWAADGNIKEGALLKTGDSLGVIESCQQPYQQFRRYSRVELPKLEDKIYFADGDNSGIKIYDINIDDKDKVASFRVEFDNTFIIKASLDKAKDVNLDSYNKRVLFNLGKKFKDKFIVPEIEHNGVSIEPELGMPLIISDEMQYKIKSPTGIEQVWEIVTSPVCKTHLEDQKARSSKQIVIKADIVNKKGVEYQWYYDGKAIEDQLSDQLILDDPSDNKKHKIYFVASNDAGSFQSENITVLWENPQDTSQNHHFVAVTDFFVNLFSPRKKMSDVTPKKRSKITYCMSENNLIQNSAGNCHSSEYCKYNESSSEEEFNINMADEVNDDKFSEAIEIDEHDIYSLKDSKEIKDSKERTCCIASDEKLIQKTDTQTNINKDYLSDNLSVENFDKKQDIDLDNQVFKTCQFDKSKDEEDELDELKELTSNKINLTNKQINELNINDNIIIKEEVDDIKIEDELDIELTKSESSDVDDIEFYGRENIIEDNFEMNLDKNENIETAEVEIDTRFTRQAIVRVSNNFDDIEDIIKSNFDTNEESNILD